MKRAIFILSLLATGCSTKPSSPAITAQNVTEVLTQYGKDHPESDVVIETKFGVIKIKLYEDTPLHRANFVKLIKDDYYRDAEFYRIVPGFVVQGGDLKKTYPYLIPAEFRPNHYHKKGAVAMARSDDDNPAMQSSSTEFYIMQGTLSSEEDIDEEAKVEGLTLTPEQRKDYLTIGGDMTLDQKYTVFGEVTEGLDVVDKITHVQLYGEKPLQKVTFKISIPGAK